jgi:hypothetical protein
MTQKHWIILAAILALALGFFAGHEETAGGNPSLPVYTMGQQSPSAHAG